MLMSEILGPSQMPKSVNWLLFSQNTTNLLSTEVATYFDSRSHLQGQL